MDKPENILMRTNVRGRIRNISLSADRALVPVFEAIANSLQAIEQSGRADGKLSVVIHRDSSQANLIDAEFDTGPINGFEIIDNGIGFDDDNFKSFRTADSQFKRGGRGIGRFLWLKAFDRVSVHSVGNSKAAGSPVQRSFRFVSTDDGIEDYREKVVDAETGTTVELIGFHPKYQVKTPRHIEIIADKIIEHFLITFIAASRPEFELMDPMTRIDLVQRFDSLISEKVPAIPFKIKDHDFRLHNFRFYGKSLGDNELHLCASDRVVQSYKLEKLIPDVAGGLTDPMGGAFRVSTYVLGEYLDENANQERSAFNIEEEASVLDELSLNEIRDAAVGEVTKELREIIEPIAEDKIEGYTRYVYEEAPEFRSFIKRHPAVLQTLPAGLSRDKLDGHLNREKFKLNEQLKRETRDYLKSEISEATDIEKHFRVYQKLVSEISDLGVDQLAEYVIYRKSVIQLLERSLGFAETGKYNKEEVIHRLFFPIRKSSDEVDFEQQNLWLIDERLSFHLFLNSDKPINKAEGIDSDSLLRPDLLVFNRALAYAEQASPIGSMVIVEFKRPLRDEYDDNDNPIVQVTNYMDEIRRAGITRPDGQAVTVPQNMPFYVYIVCTLTPKIRRILTVHNTFKLTPDQLGYFDFHEPLNAYIEVISFDKLIEDAKKRNNVLFRRLNLPIE